MITPSFITLLPPSLADWARAARARRRTQLLQAFWLSLLMGAAYIAFGIDNIVLPIVMLMLIMLPVLLWHFPRLAVYLTFSGVCLFELQSYDWKDSITDRVPFFWNVNTIFQSYAHIESFKAVPFSAFELLVLLAGFLSIVRGIYSSQTKIKTGALFPYLMGYITFVVLGWMHGMSSGGDFKVSLMEVRSQFYLLLAYLMAVNTFTNRRQLMTLYGLFIAFMIVKGAMYTFRHFVTLAGLPLPDQGVGSHEEAFLFNCFVVLLMVFTLCDVHRPLRRWLILGSPIVILGNMATNRRAATAALVIVIPALFLCAIAALPKRRRVAIILGCILAVTSVTYYRIFKYSNAFIAQPARAIKSQFEPDQRDQSSNDYRIAENANLLITIKSSPIIGYGYGKHMIVQVPMANIADVYQYWDIMTHNQILWVWMRVGSIGFFAFWIMMAGIFTHCCMTIRRTDITMEARAVNIFTIQVAIMLLLFGLFDLQLSNPRDMLFTGFWIGLSVVAVQPGVTNPDEIEKEKKKKPAESNLLTGGSL